MSPWQMIKHEFGTMLGNMDARTGESNSLAQKKKKEKRKKQEEEEKKEEGED